MYDLINDTLDKEKQEFFVESLIPVILTQSMERYFEYRTKPIDLDKGVIVDTTVFDSNSVKDIPQSCWHSHYELNLILNGFDVKHVHRDIYNKNGDEGGFITVIASKDNKWYSFISGINQSFDIDGTEELYSEFDNYEDATKFVRNFVKEVCTLTIDMEGELYLDGEFDYLEDKYNFEILTKENHHILSGFFWSITTFVEYIFENSIALMNIDKCGHYHSTPDFRLYGDNRFDDYLIEYTKLIKIEI